MKKNKPEYLPKENVLMALTGEFDTDISANEYISHCQNNINAIKPISEEDIIKPYLRKLKSKIKDKFGGLDICEYVDDYDWEENDISHYDSVGSVDEIIDMIDNLLSPKKNKR